MKRIAFVSTVVIFSSLMGCTSFNGKARGIADAKRRLQNGELVQTVTMGRYADWIGEYRQILRDEYGIAQEGMLGESIEYIEGFESVMNPEISRRFDREFFDSIGERP